MIPKEKYDVKSIDKLNSVSDTEVLENAYLLLEWLQDVNWPVFEGAVRRLSVLGTELIEPINEILEGNDNIWKANIIGHLIPTFSKEAQRLYTKSLETILAKHDEQDLKEGVIDYVEMQLINVKKHTYQID